MPESRHARGLRPLQNVRRQAAATAGLETGHVEDVLDPDRDTEKGRLRPGAGPVLLERRGFPAQALEPQLLGQKSPHLGLAHREERLQAIEIVHARDCRRLSAASFTASTMCW